MKQLWQQQVQIFPLLLAISLVDIVGFLRKLRPLPYAPIYFSAYPLSELNGRVARFYEEIDPSSGSIVEEPTAKELDKIKRRATWGGIWSFLLSALVVPVVSGIACAFFVQREDLGVLVFILLTYKMFSTVHAVRHFEKDAISNHKSAWIVFATYSLYVIVLCWTFYFSYNWAHPFILKQDYTSMLSEGINFIIEEVILKGIFIAVVATFFVSYIADKNTKHELTRERAS